MHIFLEKNIYHANLCTWMRKSIFWTVNHEYKYVKRRYGKELERIVFQLDSFYMQYYFVLQIA